MDQSQVSPFLDLTSGTLNSWALLMVFLEHSPSDDEDTPSNIYKSILQFHPCELVNKTFLAPRIKIQFDELYIKYKTPPGASL